jgi:hypothetical protein
MADGHDSTRLLRVCLDTVITSDRVLKDLRPPAERDAAAKIEELHNRGLIERVTTPVSRAEESRTANHEKRAALQAGWPGVSVVQPEPTLLGFHTQDLGYRGFISSPIMSDVDDALMQKLRAIPLAENDARAVAFAASTDCDYFVTHDERDLLPHRIEIEAICSQIRIVKPTEFLAAYRTITAGGSGGDFERLGGRSA